MSNDCNCGKCNCRYNYLCYYCKKEKEIDQLKKTISDFEKLMAQNILIPSGEYESLIAIIKKAYNPNYVIDTNRKMMVMSKKIDQLEARIFELEKENQRLKELSGN